MQTSRNTELVAANQEKGQVRVGSISRADCEEVGGVTFPAGRRTFRSQSEVRRAVAEAVRGIQVGAMIKGLE